MSSGTGRLSDSVKAARGHWKLLQSCRPGCRFVSAHADPKRTQTWLLTPHRAHRPSQLPPVPALWQPGGSCVSVHAHPGTTQAPKRQRLQYGQRRRGNVEAEKGFGSSWPCSSPPGSSTGPSQGEAEPSKGHKRLHNPPSPLQHFQCPADFLRTIQKLPASSPLPIHTNNSGAQQTSP